MRIHPQIISAFMKSVGSRSKIYPSTEPVPIMATYKHVGMVIDNVYYYVHVANISNHNLCWLYLNDYFLLMFTCPEEVVESYAMEQLHKLILS